MSDSHSTPPEHTTVPPVEQDDTGRVAGVRVTRDTAPHVIKPTDVPLDE